MLVELFPITPGARLRTYEPAFLHLISAFALAVLVIIWVDNIIVNDGNTRRSDGHTLWLVSDITSIISAGITLVRLVSGAWVITTAWRCAFTLMKELPGGFEAEGLNNVTSASPLVCGTGGAGGSSVTTRGTNGGFSRRWCFSF